MVNGVTIDDVLQKSNVLFNLEDQFWSKPLSNWFADLMPLIRTKIDVTTHDGQRYIYNCIELEASLNKMTKIVKDIGLSIVQKFSQAGIYPRYHTVVDKCTHVVIQIIFVIRRHIF